MTVKDVCACMERIAPQALSRGVCERFGDYDNSGLLMDFCRGEVRRVVVALDASMAVFSEAVALGAQMIVCHHPVIYSPIKSVSADDSVTRKILIASRHGLSVYAAHLNLDSVEGGINEQYARLCGLTESRNLCDLDGANGYMRLGELEQPCTLAELKARLEAALDAPIRAVGRPDRPIKRVCAVNGGGGSLLARAQEAGADCYVSGDFRHHEYIDALDRDLCLLDVPHYDAEKFYMRTLAAELAEMLPDAQVLESRAETRPFWA